ncbi:MAG: (2Fe-2S)-binding protein [Chloroflexi bacterium]|nr:(2Fe-2S)-binding protein [Chloroflexota bacterium]
MSGTRAPSDGRIDRNRPLSFTFDGRAMTGFAGDTLASALMANGVDVIGRGIYTGRPRGIVAAGVEEPNAIVQVERADGVSEPSLRATTVELEEGLRVQSLAGRGRLESPGDAVDAGRFDARYAHCDVLVVGGGPAGLAAALAAGRSGARTILVDADTELGGTLLGTRDELDREPALDWVRAAAGELAALPETTILLRATAIAYHDHQDILVAERRPDARTEGRLWHIRAGQVVLATGAHERLIVFADNDRPGIMLASAALTYLHRYGVVPGQRAVIYTTNDSTRTAAAELTEAGIEIVDVVDSRDGRAVSGSEGGDRLEAVVVDGERRGCDLLLVSGGWNPVVHLFSQSRGSLRWDDGLATYLPERAVQATHVAGSANGVFDLDGCLREGAAVGARAAAEAGFGDGRPPVMPAADGGTAIGRVAPIWFVPAPEGETAEARMFVDLERDATVADIRRATGAGLASIEHIKRYTTIGTAGDQGKTSGVVASAVAAALLGQEPGALGVPTFRAPYVPISFAFIAGRDRGALSDPIRTTSIQPWHVAHGAVFEDVGQWKRPRFFPRAGESMDAAVLRECAAARTSVGVMDASTLGKIDLQGPDAGDFLDRVYTNGFAKLKVGSCRYGVMCRVDGMVFDDGVTSRLADDRFHMTTTTGNAAPVLDHLEEWLQTEWPELRVRATSVTEQWATVAVVGPRSRDVLAVLAPELDVSADGFPFMTWRESVVAGLPARVFRISFSGELAYEINVSTWHGLAMWEEVMAAGERFGITPYGTEAMHVLRAEKGYPIIGQETDGTVTPQDLGMEWVVSKTKPFIGSRSHRRAENRRPDRKQLVALLPLNPDALIPEGNQLVAAGTDLGSRPVPMIGHVTSSYRSAFLGRTFALALVRGGRERHGEAIVAPLADGTTIEAWITDPVVVDPDNARRDG